MKNLSHDAAIDALCKCAASISVLSYQEAIEGYFKLRGLPIPAAPSLAAQDGLVEALRKLRDAGWMVAVHNDYRLCGNYYTFWLFTHPDGRWIKGEGETDTVAVEAALASIEVKSS